MKNDPNNRQHHPQQWTADGLAAIIIESLTRQNWTPDEIRGYLAAQLENGVLRDGVPNWQRDSVALTMLLPYDRDHLRKTAANIGRMTATPEK